MEKFILMVRILHINKVNQDNPRQISKAQLSGNLFCSFQINLTIGFLHFLFACKFTAVYINRYKCFCLLDYQKTATVQPDFFVLNLFQHSFQTVKFIKRQKFIFVKAQFIFFFRAVVFKIIRNLLRDFRNIRYDFFKISAVGIPDGRDIKRLGPIYTAEAGT